MGWMAILVSSMGEQKNSFFLIKISWSIRNLEIRNFKYTQIRFIWREMSQNVDIMS